MTPLTYAFAFNIAASGLPGIGELAGIERDPSLDQPPRQRDVALRIDAGGIGELRPVELEQDRAA